MIWLAFFSGIAAGAALMGVVVVIMFERCEK